MLSDMINNSSRYGVAGMSVVKKQLIIIAVLPMSLIIVSCGDGDSSSGAGFALSNTRARLCDSVSLRICVSGYVENLSDSTKSAKINVSIPSTKSGWPSANHSFSRSVNDSPPLNWSTRYDSSGRTNNEYQTT